MTSAGLASAREMMETARLRAELVDLSWLVPQRQRDPWTLDDDTLRFMASLTSLLRPRLILEFGSGVSTRVLAAAAAGLDDPASVVALESDPVFARRARRDLAGDVAGGVARVELTHLVARRWYGRNVPVYDLPATIRDDGPPQLVLVDGPPLPLGGRVGSLFQAVHLGEAGTVVVLDDAYRQSERAALVLAEDIFGAAIDVVPLDGFAKGLVALVVGHTVEGPPMPPPPEAGRR